MADLRAAKQAVRDHAERLHLEASRQVLEELRRAVPDSDAMRATYPAGEYPQRLPKLRDSQHVTRSTNGDRISMVVGYTAPQANYTETGTSPHKIRAKNAPTLRFYWPKVSAVVWPVEVNHPGSHKHDGWFSKITAQWPEFLRRARRA